MDAAPVLAAVARALNEQRLEAVMIGNAAAALRGAPVTTLDVDFLFRPTPTNLRKLKAVAKQLGATIFQPYYPVSNMYRLIKEDGSLQLDFMGTIHGIRSFEALRSRAADVQFGRFHVTIAALEDIIRSKKAAARPQDKAVLQLLEMTLEEQKIR